MSHLSITVVIPTHNRASLVGRAVASALTATDPDDEVIVVDDGSTDDTEAALAVFGSRIRYIQTRNRGAGAARNRGVAEARNPLVALLDSDDEFMPDKLQLQRTVMEARPDVVFCGSDFALRYDSGGVRRRHLAHWHGDARGWEAILGRGVPYSAFGPCPEGRDDFLVHIGDLYPTMARCNYVATFTVLVRVAAAGEARFAPEHLAFHEDWAWFARLSRLGPVAHLDCETAWNWGHDGPRMTHTADLLKMAARLQVLHETWGSDEAFLTRHGRFFRRLVSQEHVNHGRQLLADGRTREAREEFARAGDALLNPQLLASRALALLPGPVARLVIGLGRRALQHAFLALVVLPQDALQPDGPGLDLGALWDVTVAAMG